MSEPNTPASGEGPAMGGQAAVPPVPPSTIDGGGSQRPPMRLPVWVVIALILILFSSCSAARDASDAASSAREAANQSGITNSGSTTLDEVQAMCRLLGAVAGKQGIDLDKVFEGDHAVTDCQEVAQGAATP